MLSCYSSVLHCRHWSILINFTNMFELNSDWLYNHFSITNLLFLSKVLLEKQIHIIKLLLPDIANPHVHPPPSFNFPTYMFPARRIASVRNIGNFDNRSVSGISARYIYLVAIYCARSLSSENHFAALPINFSRARSRLPHYDGRQALVTHVRSRLLNLFSDWFNSNKSSLAVVNILLRIRQSKGLLL